MGTENMAVGAGQGPDVTPTTEAQAGIAPAVEAVRRAGGIPESVTRLQRARMELGGEPVEPDKTEEPEKPDETKKEEKSYLKKEKTTQNSTFEQALDQAKKLQEKVNYSQLNEEERSDFRKDLTEIAIEIDRLLGMGMEEGVLTFLRDDVRRIYLEATAESPPTSDSDWYPSAKPKSIQERIDEVYEALGWDRKTKEFNYEERFWDYGSLALRRAFRDVTGQKADPIEMREKYKGMASFVASKVALAIEKRLKGIEPDPTKDFGDFFLADIERELAETSEEREQDRKKKRKRATAKERLHYNNWRERFDFTWAEDVDELRDTVHDWLDIFARQIPRESAEKVNESIQTGRRNAISALEAAAHRIGIEKGSTVYVELQDTIEGHVDATAGVEMQNRKGGLEAHTAYLEDFANNFNGHHDGIYLRRLSALIQRHLSLNDGEASLGGPPTKEKPMERDTKEYKSQKEWEAKMYAYSHELYISEDDFRTAVTYKAAFEKSIREEVAQLDPPPENIEAEIKQRVDEKLAAFEQGIIQEVEEFHLPQEEARREIKRRLGEKLGRYGWHDTIEELLLVDARGTEKAKAKLGPYRQMTETIEQEVAGLGLPPDQVQREISQRVIEEIRKLANNDADEFNAAMADYQERWNKRKEGLVKVDKRTGVFKTIKERSDKRDGLFGKTPEERREIIRARIRKKMRDEKRYGALLDEINALPDQEAQDMALWKWVKDFNDFREASKGGTEHDQGFSAPEPWFPSSWDEVRLRIDRPGKLPDRALEDDQLEAMIEEVDDPYINLTKDQIRKQIRKEFIEDIRRQIKQEGVAEDKVAEVFKARLAEKENDIKSKIDDVLFSQQQRMTEAVREYTINRVYQKFLGLEARYGGLTTRVLNKEGIVELRTISSLARDILKAKINWEAAQIEKKVEYHGQALAQKKDEQNNPAYTPEQIVEEKAKKRRELRRDATFGATLALREIGIAHNLPIRDLHFYNHTQMIQAFTNLVEWDHNDKGFLPEFIDRGRREEEAVYNFLAEQHMDGRILVVRDNPDLDPEYEYEVELDSNNQPKIDPETNLPIYKLDDLDLPIPKKDANSHLKVKKWNDDHKESFERARVINKGGDPDLMALFESRFMQSTSGGVKVADLIAKVGDLGIRDMLWEYGCENLREFQGLIKRRDEVERGDQVFWNTEKWAGPISYAQRLRGAIAARVFLVGGELKGIGKVLGLLNEPLMGAWRFRDEFFELHHWIDDEPKDLIKQPRSPYNMSDWRQKMRDILEGNDATKLLGDIAKDKLVSMAGEILKNVVDYMTALDYVRNTAGFASKNWQYNDNLILKGIFEEYAKREPVMAKFNEVLLEDPQGRKILAEAGDLIATEGGEMLGEQHLSYAPEGRTKAARILFRAMLQGSTYHTLDQDESRRLALKGREVRRQMAEKRDRLLVKIMPENKITAYKTKQKELEKEKKETLPSLQAEFVEFLAKTKKEIGKNPKDDEFEGYQTTLDAKRQKLKEKNIAIKALEVAVCTEMNTYVQDELNKQFKAGDMTNAELRSTIMGRREELARMRARPGLGNIERDISRIIDQYVDYQLRMQFPGEWYARVADIDEAA